MTTKNNDKTTPRPPEEVIIAKVKREDGSEYIVTGADFIKGLELQADLTLLVAKLKASEETRTITDEEREQLEVFAQMLRYSLTELSKEQRNGLEESLQTILKATEQLIKFFDDLKENPQAKNQITEFLRGQRDFMTVARPRGIEDFLKIKDSGVDVVREFKNSTITFTGRFGMNEHKIAELIRMRFTELNPHGATKNLDTLIDIPLTDIMQAMGRTVTPNNKKMFVRKLTREILPTISHAHITLHTETENGIEHKHMEVGGGYFEVSSKKDRILFRISPEYALYLNTKSQSQYHRITFQLGDSQSGDELPYYLAIKLQDHYFKDQNRNRNTNTILSVKSVLSFCADNIEYEYILETDPTHWKFKIKRRLEDALNKIQRKGLFKWEYCGAKLKEIPQAAIDAADFHEWSKLYITFQFIPEEPDQSERLQHKRERIEAAIEKKQQEIDKNAVEADKIRKRRRRKKAPKE